MRRCFVSLSHVSSANIFIRFVVQHGYRNVGHVRKLNNFEMLMPVGIVRLVLCLSSTIRIVRSLSCVYLLDSRLADFIRCPFNSAINRQTRMLSTLNTRCQSLPLAYDDFVDLTTAKINLQSMEFFGLTEYLTLSQRLFERTSYCRIYRMCSFQSYLEQDPNNKQTSNFVEQTLTRVDVDRLKQMNSDDIELYRFARRLFFQRTCQVLGVAC
jgi:hypothetical protein